MNNVKSLDELKLGVGICTRNRPNCLDRVLKAVAKYSTGPVKYDIFVADDGSENEDQREYLTMMPFEWNEDDRERVGVAKNKNRILRHFSDYDYMAIWEDDAYPILPDWFKVHILASQASNIEHFSFSPHSVPEGSVAYVGDTYEESHYELPDGKKVTVRQTQNTTGVFLFFSSKVIDKVGGFDSRFGLWGYEHVEYADRIKDPRIGLAPPHGYPSLLNCEEFIKWDDSVPSVVTEAEKAELRISQKKLWNQVREECFLYRPI